MKKAENLIQQECVMSFRNKHCLKHHNPRCVIFSVPNESTDGWEAQKKVNTGLLRGVSDCIILLPGRISVFMECKTPDGVQSEDQRKFQLQIEALGFDYHIYRSLDQFWNIINPYLIWLKKY